MERVSGILSRFTADRTVPVFIGLLLTGFVILEFDARHLWFFGDEFAFLVGDRLQDAASTRALLHDILVPHNEHLSILPKLWYWFADSIWGLRTYWPYVTAAILVHLFVVTMVWTLMRRVGVDRWIAVGAAMLLIVFGPGWENIFWGFQVGFMGAVGLGLAALLLADHTQRVLWRDIATAVLTVLALATAGPAVAVVAGVAIVLVLRRGIKASVLILIIPIVLYAAWLKLYAVGVGASRAHLHDIYAYALAQIMRTLEAIVGVPGVGGVALVALLAFAGWRWRSAIRADRSAPLVALLFTAAMFALITGYGRAFLGIEQASSSRYIYLQAVFLIPVLAYALSAVPQAGGLRRSLAVIFITLSVASAVVALQVGVHDRSTFVLSIRDQLLGASIDPVIMGSMAPGVVINPEFTPNVTVGGLRYVQAAGELPPWSTSTQYRDDLRRLLAVTAQAAPPGGWAPAGQLNAVRQDGVVVSSEQDQCVAVHATGEHGTYAVAVVPGQSFVIAGDVASAAAHIVVDDTAIGIDLPGDGTQALTVNVPGDLSLDVSNSPVTICPVQMPSP